jgi:hypothetical protein
LDVGAVSRPSSKETEMQQQDSGKNRGMGYGRFAAMIATSTVVMFGLMYLNTYALATSNTVRPGRGWPW